MEKKGKGLAGLGAIGAIVGVLLLTGVLSIPGALAKILGIGLLVGAGLIAALVIATVIIAFKTAGDENSNVKADVASLIRTKEQEISKLKSKVAIAKLDVKKVFKDIAKLEEKIEECDKKSEECVAAGNEEGARQVLTTKSLYNDQRDRLLETVSSYERTISDSNNRITALQNEILDLQNRRDDALSMLNDANAIKNGQAASLDKLEEDAQFQKDYAEALKELEEKQSMAGVGRR